MKKDNGGPAFPGKQTAVIIPASLRDDPRIEEISTTINGMTLRDYFAAKAMQGAAIYNHDNFMCHESCATTAYMLADAMLKARLS